MEELDEIIKKIEDIPHSTFKTNCIECGEELTLHFNGGELDMDYCCDYTYSTIHKRIDFIVTKD